MKPEELVDKEFKLLNIVVDVAFKLLIDNVELVDLCSEDVALCKNIQAAGYIINLHTNLRVGHEKPIVL